MEVQKRKTVLDYILSYYIYAICNDLCNSQTSGIDDPSLTLRSRYLFSDTETIMSRVVHLTTVHNPFDNRIFHRECKTLAAAGYEVVLMAEHGNDESQSGISIRALPHAGSRLARMSLAVGRTFRLALTARADLYHFHDPELIPAGLLLRFLGKQVIYDIHEDNFTAIREREYLPSWLRGLVARTFALAEAGASRYFHLILAERYYAERFPRGTTILNYARFPELDETALAQRPRAENPRLIYTGNVKEYRGARYHAQLLQHLPSAEVFLVGRCDKDLAVDLQRTIDSTRLHFEGVGTYVPHERIVDYYLREYWTAGLALFPPSQHTSRKELTKLFEYMAYGIPVLCSNFPNLREIVEGAECGLCVNSTNGAEAAEAVRYLWEHPDQARRMGENGRESARTTYNWDTQAEKLLDFYAGIL